MNRDMLKLFRDRIAADPVLGVFMKSTDPAFVEAAGFAGMDFAILDMEHGPVSVKEMENNVRAAQVAGILPIIRVPKLSENEIGKALDAGAAGVQIPQITCAEEARQAVRAARFSPVGERGVCRFVRAAHYSSEPREQYFAEGSAPLVILQLEGSEAVKNLDAILLVEGVDILFIGPYDLSQSMGLLGQTSHPDVVARMKEIARRAGEKCIPVGVFADDNAGMRLWLEAGVRYLAYSVDVGLFTEACADQVKKFHLCTD